jgi:hypothetical protein
MAGQEEMSEDRGQEFNKIPYFPYLAGLKHFMKAIWKRVSATGLKGNINTIIRNGSKVYQIKGNAMTSLVTTLTTDLDYPIDRHI